MTANFYGDEEPMVTLEKLDLPDDVEPILMTEDVVAVVVEHLESNEFLEGVHFLIDNDGSILAAEGVDTVALTRRGYQVKVLS